MSAPGAGGTGPGSRGRRRRISRSADFERVYREGRSHASRHLVLYAFPRTQPGDPRLGVSVGRRVGPAVERNRVKRMLREAFWNLAPELPPDHDFVLVARPEAGALARERGQPALEASLRELANGAGLTEEASS
jgi:ribonuclease P protein component